MVGNLKQRYPDKGIRGESSFIIELVGPAGAGKTTLANALIQRSEKIFLSNPPYFRKIEHFPFFAKNTLSMLPVFLQMFHQKSRKPTPLEIAWMVTLNGWHHVLRQQLSEKRSIILLDQGPVFMLSTLNGLGNGNPKHWCTKNWWNRNYQDWANTLDFVIWLDTSDELLLERISARDKSHFLKGKNKVESIQFLAQYRNSYRQAIALLESYTADLKVIRLDTGKYPLDSVVDQILVELG